MTRNPSSPPIPPNLIPKAAQWYACTTIFMSDGCGKLLVGLGSTNPNTQSHIRIMTIKSLELMGTKACQQVVSTDPNT